MIFGFGTKEPVRPLTKYVKDNYGCDEFIKNNKDEVNIFYLALTIGVKEGEKFKKDRGLRKIFKGTNTDIIACEFALFAIRQAILIDDIKNTDLGDLLMDASRILGAIGGKFYDDFEIWYSNRARRYFKPPKEASEGFAFNLVAVAGVDNFVGLTNKSSLDLKSQIQTLALALTFREIMVPAFIESVKIMIERDF